MSLRNLIGSEKNVKKANRIRNKLLNIIPHLLHTDDHAFDDYREHITEFQFEIERIKKAKTFIKHKQAFNSLIYRKSFGNNETDYYFESDLFKKTMCNLIGKKAYKKLHIYPRL